MKSILVIVLLLATVGSYAHAEDEACDMLFVQDAKAMVFDGSLLTLKEANPNIIFFCDRPVRTAGQTTRPMQPFRLWALKARSPKQSLP